MCHTVCELEVNLTFGSRCKERCIDDTISCSERIKFDIEFCYLLLDAGGEFSVLEFVLDDYVHEVDLFLQVISAAHTETVSDTVDEIIPHFVRRKFRLEGLKLCSEFPEFVTVFAHPLPMG